MLFWIKIILLKRYSIRLYFKINYWESKENKIYKIISIAEEISSLDEDKLTNLRILENNKLLNCLETKAISLKFDSNLVLDNGSKFR